MKLKLLFASICLIFFVENGMAQTGDSCNDPILASVGDTNVADHTAGTDQWYTYTATIDGKITVSTCDLTTKDTYVTAYSSCNNSLGSNDDYCNRQSSYSFECKTGEIYLIKWDDRYAANSTYNWSLVEELPAQGEFCSNPIDAVSGDNSFTGVQNQFQWFSYTATQDGKITLSSCGNTTDNTNVSMYTECEGGTVAYNNNFCDSQSKVVFEVVSGTTYLIRWQDVSSSDGFTWTLAEENWAQGEVCSNPLAATVGDTNVADHTAGTDQWYTYTATIDGKITVSTCDLTTENTYVSVYSSCNNSLGSNDDYCNGQSSYSFECKTGEIYLIKWDDRYAANSTYNWSLVEELPAQGEFCSNPIDAASGDNSFTGVQNQFQWYSYTATQDGKITLSSCGNTTDNTNVNVYTECEGGTVAYNNNFCDSQSKVVIEVVSGTTYLIRWQDVSSSDGFTWTLAEENWDQGEVCSNPLVAVAGTTNQADHTAGTDQWYTYTATIDGKITVSTCDLTTENTYVSVYSSCNNLLGSNNDYCNSQSSYSFECKTGEIYLIKWDDRYAANSTYNWSLVEELPAQGEFCSNPIDAASGDNSFTGVQNQFQWYSYTATQDGKITLSSCGNTTDNTNVSVYTECGGGTVANNSNFSNSQSKVVIEVVSETTYLIRWQDVSSSDGFTWTLTEEDWAQGEVCSNPLAATVGDTNVADHTAGTDQWYSYTATIDGKITVSTCDLTTEDTYVSVYSSCNNLLGSNDDYCNNQSSYSFLCTTGEIYLIKWNDRYAANSKYNWSLVEELPAQGEACSNPLAAIVGDTNMADHTAGTDQWYRYESQVNGSITLSTVGLTTEDTKVFVYDDCGGVLIDSNDDSSGTQSEISFTGVVGGVYFIKWDNQYTNGTYNWSLTQDGVAAGVSDDLLKEEIEVKIYPNPATNEFRVKSKKDVLKVRIFNTSGELVSQIAGNTNTYFIDLQSGVYVVDIELADKVVVHKRLVVK